MVIHSKLNSRKKQNGPHSCNQSNVLQNLVDGVDVPLSMTRTELATLCEGELGEIKNLVRGCLEEAATDVGSLAGAQAFGGGCRMPIVQDAVGEEVP